MSVRGGCHQHVVTGKSAGFFLVILLGALLTACTRPASMLVREGESPNEVDENVVFRTTYYFRVFDYCQLEKRVKKRFPNAGLDNGDPKNPFDHRLYTVMNDTMYRFTMTGKAKSLYTRVHFESGTLKAHEIDPLGTPMRIDWETGKYTFAPSSKSETGKPAINSAELAKIRTELAQIDGITGLDDDEKAAMKQALMRKYGAILGTPVPEPEFLALMKSMKPEDMLKQVDGMKSLSEATELDRKTKNAASAKALEAYAKSMNVADAPAATISCPSGIPVRKGFQILGPEGWRTFDQDERLIMAMSTTGEPLTSVLKELSKRVLDAKNAEPAQKLAVLEEQYRILDAERTLDAGYGEPQSCEALGLAKECSEMERLVAEMKRALDKTTP